MTQAISEDGKFKKRFNQIQETNWLRYGTYKVWTDEYSKVFDEAKNEFPNFKNIIQQFQEGNTWIPNDFPSTEACRDMIIWFLKWFGEHEV